MTNKIFITSKIEIDKHNQTHLKISTEIIDYIESFKFKTNVGYHVKEKNINNFVKNNDGLILSGGGDINKIEKNKKNLLRDNFEKKLLNKFLKNNKPILCICRGFQLFSSLNGANLIKSKNHIRKTHNLKIKRNSRFINTSKLKVNSFHNLMINSLDEKQLNIISKTKDGSIEIVEHKKKKLLCFMFHPERKNISQKKIDIVFRNFFK